VVNAEEMRDATAMTEQTTSVSRDDVSILTRGGLAAINMVLSYDTTSAERIERRTKSDWWWRQWEIEARPDSFFVGLVCLPRLFKTLAAGTTESQELLTESVDLTKFVGYFAFFRLIPKKVKAG